MPASSLLRLAFCLAGALLAFVGPAAEPAPKIRANVAFENVSVIDVARGEVVGPRTVTVVEGCIVAIETPAPAGASWSGPPQHAPSIWIDGTGCFLIPGLVDLHVH